jgi:hypothetical protein
MLLSDYEPLLNVFSTERNRSNVDNLQFDRVINDFPMAIERLLILTHADCAWRFVSCEQLQYSLYLLEKLK